jgi:HicA toxin of bacterial toxin-antitoxin,
LARLGVRGTFSQPGPSRPTVAVRLARTLGVRNRTTVALGTVIRYHLRMKRAHQRTLEAVFAHPTSANIAWKDIEALFGGLGAEVSEREGSRVAIVLFNEVRVFHRPHPSPKTDKGAVVSVRKWLEQHGVRP